MVLRISQFVYPYEQFTFFLFHMVYAKADPIQILKQLLSINQYPVILTLTWIFYKIIEYEKVKIWQSNTEKTLYYSSWPQIRKAYHLQPIGRHRSCGKKEHQALLSNFYAAWVGEIRIALANQGITATSFFLKPEIRFEIFSDISEARAYLLLS